VSLKDNPIFLKEIRPEFWQKSSRLSRYTLLALLALVLLAPTALVVRYWRDIDASTAGMLLVFFGYWPTFLCPALMPALIAGAIAGERERQTWDALVLTRLRPAEIIWGKLLARLFPVALLTLVLAPMAIAFLIKAGPEEIRLGLIHSAPWADDYSYAAVFFTWTLGMAVAFANGVLALFISMRAASARSALISSYIYAGMAYLVVQLLGYLLLLFPLLFFSSIYSSHNPFNGQLHFYLSQTFILLWALLIPLILLPQLIGGFARLDRKARGG